MLILESCAKSWQSFCQKLAEFLTKRISSIMGNWSLVFLLVLFLLLNYPTASNTNHNWNQLYIMHRFGAVALFIISTLSVLSTSGEGGRSWGRGRVPGRTGRRARCCGFAEVLGLWRAELTGTNIGFRDFKMTAWSFQTSLAKWDLLTHHSWWDIEWNISKIAVFRQKAVWRPRIQSIGPPQAGSISEMC